MQQQSEIVSKLLLLNLSSTDKPKLLVCCSYLIHASVNKTCHSSKLLFFYILECKTTSLTFFVLFEAVAYKTSTVLECRNEGITAQVTTLGQPLGGAIV